MTDAKTITAAEALERQRSEFNAVVQSAPEAILTKDLDGTILSWNAAAEALYGYGADEVVGQPVALLLPGDRKDEVVRLITRVQTGEQIREFETVRVCKDGRAVNVSLTISPVRDGVGAIVGAATIAVDAGKRREAEQHRRLAAMVESAIDPMFSVDEASRIVTWNAAAERLFGYPPQAMVGEPIGRLFGATEVPAEMRPDRLMAPVDPAAPAFDVTLRTAAGDEVIVAATVSPMVHGDVPARAAAVILRDVTERRHLEARLRQKQKLEAIGSLASGVAHDFNNVLSVIRGASGLLAMNEQTEDARALLSEIDRAAAHASDLTAQLLAFGRQQMLRPEPTDLVAFLVPTLTMVRKLVTAKVRIEHEFADRLPTILIDRTQLTQIVLNLCVNAGQAMPDGGVLTVRTRLDEHGSTAGRSSSDAQRVALEVIDTGVGMDDATREKVFDPFFTTKASGTGLGLATVQGIVEQSGGRIEVASRLGEGTTFSVFFPLADDGAVDRPEAHAPGATGAGSETVMVVDDSPALRTVFAKVLEASGYRVLVAVDGHDAVEVAAEFKGRIDLLLCDVVMPGLGGREVYELLHRSWPDIRVLFTSGYTADDVLRHGIATGQFDFIQKPSTNAALLTQVRTTLDRPRA